MAKRRVVMRTRYFDSLSNGEIKTYLGRNDVIFIPVGTVEYHGEMPVGAEHVLPLAFAVRLAEKTDALVLPHLVYFYPGATAVGLGTIHVSPETGKAYLREVCASLLRQGFRRQVLLTAHGPASLTLAPFIREFFEEFHCPIAYLELGAQFHRAKPPADFDLAIWGAYHLLGRLEDIPFKQRVRRRVPNPPAMGKVFGTGARAGFFFTHDELQHGWWPDRKMTPKLRAERARKGLENIDRVLDAMEVERLLEGLRELDRTMQSEVWPKFGKRLP